MSDDHLIDFEHGLARRVRSVWSGFKGFLGRDNVLEVAVGLIMAGGFSTLVNSLVSDVLLPPISLLPFMGRNLPAKFMVLRAGPNYPYNTLRQAAEDGAVTLAYGAFLDNLVTFVALGFVLYGIAQMYTILSHGQTIIRNIVKCKYCRKDISQAVGIFLALVHRLSVHRQNAVVTAQAGKMGAKRSRTPPPSPQVLA